VRWGYFDASLAPIATVPSGGEVIIETVTGEPPHVPKDPIYEILPEHLPILPLLGPLPEDFPDPGRVHILLDKSTGIGRLPWGGELKLKPFFGIMGVAPPPIWGRLTSIVPRPHA